MILFKNSTFFHRLFLLKSDLGMIFGDVLERKEAFLHNINIFGFFFMILVKNSNFVCYLFLLKIGVEMMFGDVLDTKEAFQDYKNRYLLELENG